MAELALAFALQPAHSIVAGLAAVPSAPRKPAYAPN